MQENLPKEIKKPVEVPNSKFMSFGDYDDDDEEEDVKNETDILPKNDQLNEFFREINKLEK